jgi:hypothetical protein
MFSGCGVVRTFSVLPRDQGRVADALAIPRFRLNLERISVVRRPM